jgi:hypothetical protein
MVEGCSNLPVANAGQSYVLPTQLWTRRTGALNQYFNLSTQALTLRGIYSQAMRGRSCSQLLLLSIGGWL